MRQSPIGQADTKAKSKTGWQKTIFRQVCQHRQTPLVEAEDGMPRKILALVNIGMYEDSFIDNLYQFDNDMFQPFGVMV